MAGLPHVRQVGKALEEDAIAGTVAVVTTLTSEVEEEEARSVREDKSVHGCRRPMPLFLLLRVPRRTDKPRCG